jgi:lipoprotein-anchoring transpeptidase ErfK/SrfK
MRRVLLSAVVVMGSVCVGLTAGTSATPAAVPGSATRQLAWDFKTILAVQTLLDRANFSCNCIDGRFGSKTRAALAAWQGAQGLMASGFLDEATLAALGDLRRAFATHTVTTNDYAGLAPVPETWRGKAEAPTLACETILEMLAEKHHASEAALEQLNPAAAWPNPPVGSFLTVPAGGGRLPNLIARMTISLADRQVSVYDEDGRLLGLFPCSIAKEAAKRPVGELKVTRCAKDPVFVFDPAVFVESEEARTMTSKLIIPPGPNNPVGTAWIGLNLPGYGLHGTPHPEDIGETESHGCFRLANWNARKILSAISLGTPVLVQ